MWNQYWIKAKPSKTLRKCLSLLNTRERAYKNIVLFYLLLTLIASFKMSKDSSSKKAVDSPFPMLQAMQQQSE